MQITRFVTVVQRRLMTLDDSVFSLVEPLFAIETHMSVEERVRLMLVTLSLPASFVACEVGSYVGASTAFIGAAASLKNGRVHCVDTWDNRAMGVEPPRDTYSEFLLNTARFQQFITPHRGESAAVAAQIPHALDLLFIDGDHSYEATKADLDAYGHKLKPRGFLLLHDFDCDSVRQACSEYLSKRLPANLGSTQTLQCFQMSAAG